MSIRKSVALVVAALLAFPLHAASGEFVAPPLPTDSAFSCDQLNNFDLVGNKTAVTRIIDTLKVQMTAAYTKDTITQKFYRDYASQRKQGLTHFDSNINHIAKFANHVKSICLAHPRAGINDAGAHALTALYEETARQPMFATCRSFNTGLVTPDDFYRDATTHLGTSRYIPDGYTPADLDYFVTGYCRKDAGARLFTAYLHAMAAGGKKKLGRAETKGETSTLSAQQACYDDKEKYFRAVAGPDAPIHYAVMNEWRYECGLPEE